MFHLLRDFWYYYYLLFCCQFQILTSVCWVHITVPMVFSAWTSRVRFVVGNRPVSVAPASRSPPGAVSRFSVPGDGNQTPMGCVWVGHLGISSSFISRYTAESFLLNFMEPKFVDYQNVVGSLGRKFMIISPQFPCWRKHFIIHFHFSMLYTNILYLL